MEKYSSNFCIEIYFLLSLRNKPDGRIKATRASEYNSRKINFHYFTGSATMRHISLDFIIKLMMFDTDAQGSERAIKRL
jgi:hypothetical protein